MPIRELSASAKHQSYLLVQPRVRGHADHLQMVRLCVSVDLPFLVGRHLPTGLPAHPTGQLQIAQLKELPQLASELRQVGFTGQLAVLQPSTCVQIQKGGLDDQLVGERSLRVDSDLEPYQDGVT